MKIKYLILVFTIGLVSLHVKGESIRDYFVPDSAFNKVSFYTPNKYGERTNMTRTIYYLKKGILFDITNAFMFNGRASSIQTITIKFVGNEIQMVKSISTTISETNKKTTYNPPRIILKMPPDFGQKISWSYIDIPGDKINCTSSWTIVIANGEQKHAIRVTKSHEGSSVNTIEYYVKGIGLWKTELQDDNGTTQIADKFDQLDYDSTAK